MVLGVPILKHFRVVSVGQRVLKAQRIFGTAYEKWGPISRLTLPLFFALP